MKFFTYSYHIKDSFSSLIKFSVVLYSPWRKVLNYFHHIWSSHRTVGHFEPKKVQIFENVFSVLVGRRILIRGLDHLSLYKYILQSTHNCIFSDLFRYESAHSARRLNLALFFWLVFVDK